MGEEVRTDAGVGESMGNAGATVKDSIIGSLRGLHEIEAELVSLVRHTLTLYTGRGDCGLRRR
jgi:hypothetical protein